MGFFRKAKVKQRPRNDLFISDTTRAVVMEKSHVPSRPSTTKKPSYETRHNSRHSTKNERRQVDDDSIGETLDSRDHFDLFVPIKEKEKKNFLRNGNGMGLLLPSGRSFSKRRSADDSSTVSSISYDSMLFKEAKGHQQETQTISMRSIKSKQSHKTTAQRNNAQRQMPSDVNQQVENTSPESVQKTQQEYSGCCLWVYDPSQRQDIESRVPTESQKKSSSSTVRGIKSPLARTGDISLMNSTIPTFPSHDDLERKREHIQNEAVESREPTNELNEKSDGVTNRFLSLFCGPRQIPPEDLVADNTTASLQYPITDIAGNSLQDASPNGAFRAYEAPLKFDKKRSLFNPDSYDEMYEDDEHLPEPDKCFDEQATIPTYMDEGRTTIAHVESRDFSRGAKRTQQEHMQEDEINEDNQWESDKNMSKTWKLRLPRQLPTVRSVRRSLSRGRSLLSGNRSHKSGKSISSRSRGGRSRGSRSRSRRRSTGRRGGKLRRHNPQQRSRSHSRERRSVSSSMPHKHARHQNVWTEEITEDRRGKRHYR
jgi:hypothetical protein